MTRVGIDLVEVERIKKLQARYGNRFLRRIFTEAEIRYSFRARSDRCYERLAARFAAKEAVIKALGHPAAFREIEVTNDDSGKPVITCPHTNGRIGASLSHTDKLAIAYVLIEDG
jgi:holo-[acyl-carrier protein] synthase